nr:TonB-dependent receptor plug domain-containing protein [Bacteroidota bacterium]
MKNPYLFLFFLLFFSLEFLGQEQAVELVLPSDSTEVKEPNPIDNDHLKVDIGFGSLTSDLITTSISTLGFYDFNAAGAIPPQQLIQGKVAGMQMFPEDGAPGSNWEIFIRGHGKLIRIDKPLIVMDGMPLGEEALFGMPNPLDVINPEDIESFTVLRDVAASAIYGIRAENGAILITTKKGSSEHGLKFTYSGNLRLGNAPDKFGVLNASDYRSLLTERYSDNENVLNLLDNASTDWQDEIYRQAVGHNHLIALSGRVGKMPFRASAGYTGQQGVVETSGMKRTSGSLTINPKFFDDHLSIDISLRGVHNKNRYIDLRVMPSALTFDPTKAVYDANSPYGGYYTWTQANGDPTGYMIINPVALLNQIDLQGVTKRMTGNILVSYRLHFLLDLSFHLSTGIDNAKSDHDEYVSPDAAWEWKSYMTGGRSVHSEEKRKNSYSNTWLQYQKNIPGLKSTINLIAGFENQKFKYDINSLSTNADGSYFDDEFEYCDETNITSWFGRLNYTLAGRYLLMFSLRRDGHSYYPEEKRWGNSPAVGVGWIVSEEKFLSTISWLSLFKLRFSYGATGIQNDEKINPHHPIKLKETSSVNLGLDLGLFNNRLQAGIDIYSGGVSDLPFYMPVPAGTNLENSVLVSGGELSKQGAEISIGTDIIRKTNVVWALIANFSWNKNEIKSLPIPEEAIGIPTGTIVGGVGNTAQILSEGYPINTFYLLRQKYDGHGTPIEGVYLDINGDGLIDYLDFDYLKNPAPDFMLGFSSYLKYRNWQLNFSARVNLGNYVYNNTESDLGYYSRLYSPAGPCLSNISTGVFNSQFENPQYFSDYYLEDASFFRLDYLKLAYNFQLFGKTNLQLYLAGQNLFVITAYSGPDPEVSGGIDYAGYPRPRVIMVGIDLGL